MFCDPSRVFIFSVKIIVSDVCLILELDKILENELESVSMMPQGKRLSSTKDLGF